jgi:hypothetical protein
VESLALDSPENFFASVSRNAGLEFLGSRHRTDGGRLTDYTGPFYDIYDWVASTPALPGQRVKRLLFDSTTQLLAKVMYVDQSGSNAIVQTIFEGWSSTEDPVPSRIIRLENGSEVFRFDMTQTQRGPRLDAPVFRLP